MLRPFCGTIATFETSYHFSLVGLFTKKFNDKEALGQLMLEAKMLSLFNARARGSDGKLLSTKMHLHYYLRCTTSKLNKIRLILTAKNAAIIANKKTRFFFKKGT